MGFGSFGMGEMVFIFLIVLLLFGAKRLPEIGSSLGKGIREFKSSVKDIQSELSVPDDAPQIHKTHAPPGESTSQEAGDGEPRKLSDGVASGAEDR
ncbi:MAG: twin-arginine translocase TatA/TatE family subunit [Gemmatimonadota bacterium]|nr:twin-arginine translocase TatA/TatE family subunit [Gemmatimonadota bacterium]MDH3423319.1 twin-arginine translocase TatA/TatE family subunit [Gemmatimonadota bacterium]